jgi:hypothetical protein
MMILDFYLRRCLLGVFFEECANCGWHFVFYIGPMAIIFHVSDHDE